MSTYRYLVESLMIHDIDAQALFGARMMNVVKTKKYIRGDACTSFTNSCSQTHFQPSLYVKAVLGTSNDGAPSESLRLKIVDLVNGISSMLVITFGATKVRPAVRLIAVALTFLHQSLRSGCKKFER